MKRNVLRLLMMLPIWVLTTLYATSQQAVAIASSATSQQAVAIASSATSQQAVAVASSATSQQPAAVAPSATSQQPVAVAPSAISQQPDTVGASAAANQPDTLTVVPLQVQQYRVIQPFISDSLDVQGKAYDATDLLKPVNHIKLSHAHGTLPTAQEIGRASCRERVLEAV